MKYFFLVPVFFLFTPGIAQQSPTISFNGAGKIKSTLPEKLFNTDKPKFNVTDAKENFDDYKKTYQDKITKARDLLTKLRADNEKMDIMQQVFNITATDIDNVLTEMGQVNANPFLPGAPVYLPRFVADDKKYFTINTENTKTPRKEAIEPDSNSAPFDVIPAESETQVYFTLTKDNPFKKLTFNWLQTTRPAFLDPVRSAQLQQFRKDIDEFTNELKEINDFSLHYEKLANRIKAKDKTVTIAEVNTATTKSNGYIAKINALISGKNILVDLHGDKDWMLKWLWYQDNLLPAINPFGFKAAGSLGNRPDTSMLVDLRIKIQARDEFFKSLDLKKMSVHQIDSLINEMDSIKRIIAITQQAVKQYDEFKANNEKAALAFRTITSELNKGILLVGDRQKTIYWMRHHNAADNYQLMNDLESNEYLETDRVIILAHNLLPNETADLHLSFETITNDASLLAELIQPILSQLPSLVTASGQGVIPTAIINTMDGSVANLKVRLQELQRYSRCVDYLLAQSNPPLDLEVNTDKSLAYHSEVANPVRKKEGPRKAVYFLKTSLVEKNSKDSIRISKMVVDTFSYRVNKRYRLFPMAGVAWTRKEFSDITLDSATHQTKVNSQSHVRFMVGLKVYLHKTDIRSSKFITDKDEHNQCLFLSRTSITLAFETKKPLNNIYTGVGFDLWPGFCLNVGCALNKYQYNTYREGTLFASKNPYRASFYAGLSTDLSLLTEIGKFLNF